MLCNRHLIPLRFRRDNHFDTMLDQWPVIITPPSPPPNCRTPFPKHLFLLTYSLLDSLLLTPLSKIRVINLVLRLTLLLSRGPPFPKGTEPLATPLSTRTRVLFLFY